MPDIFSQSSLSCQPLARLGVHYFPDTLHYRESDLETWLPHLAALRMSWLALQAPLERAIPEHFLSGLLAAGIQPILQFRLPLALALLHADGNQAGLRLLFNAYARWGVQYVVLFDRPNLRRSWPAAAWTQADLVERFVDLFLPLAQMAAQSGLSPVLPPLQPGGDYWDLAFLRLALRSLQRRLGRGDGRLLDRLALSAYAASEDRPVDWGSGGVERWPGARPYDGQPGMQDQRGLHIADWYLPLCQAELGRSRPFFLLGAGSYAGSTPGDEIDAARELALAHDESGHAQRNLELVRCVAGGFPSTPGVENTPPSATLHAGVTAGVFWLLAAQEGTPLAASAWFQVGGAGGKTVLKSRPLVDALRRCLGTEPPASQPSLPAGEADHPIPHYILLPLYAWGAAEWDLALIAPLLQQAHPTVGFSLEEARLARRVTVVGNERSISAEALAMLQQAGCQVERLHEDGTLIASFV